MAKQLADILGADKALIFRITHRDNIPDILKNGLHCRNSEHVDPGFVPIGNPEIIDKRKARHVACRPGGTLADYVPFYFTPCTPMLYNIVSGHNGLKRYGRSEIVVLVSSLPRLDNGEIDY